VYDLKTAIIVNTIPTLSSAYCLNISPDSKIVAIGTLGVGLDTYEIETGNLLSRCPEAYKISFSPDSRLMALKTDKKSSFEIRDVNSGCLLTTIHCKDGHLSHPSFSPDGNKILTSSYWGGKTWEMAYPSLSDLIKEVKKRFNNRELTEKEKEQFYLK
jgi:WD40 repeat protein